MLTCPSCGQENPEGFRFCGACASPLAEEGPEPREERKIVTVLFCDLVGSTAAAERLDPEDVRAILSRYHERVRTELEGFGGTVEKFIGDAVMALFGAPTAHEDDPERALRAALAIRDWASDEGGLQVRIGITTGEALVALGANPRAGEGMASGDVVNTAARLQSAAPVDGILVDETTYRATRDSIEYQDYAPVEAKGKADRIPAWAAGEARARPGTDVRQQGRAPLVGRQGELDVLLDALARARRERSTQLVTLVGEPGIGKSRLVYELFQAAEADPELIYWRQGRSLPYGEGVSYWALVEIVKAQAGILETDTADEAERKLHAVVADAVPEDAEAAWVERHLRPLAGLGSPHGGGGDRRGEAFAAWRRFLETLADRRPLVLVFDDLHWADDGLLDFVDHLVEWASGVPLLVLGTARPELLDRRPGWGGGKRNAVTISLEPLSDLDTARLVHLLLASDVLPAELQQALVERAGGNPLYAEQFARLAVEGRGLDELPETVQGIVAARLDLLAPEEKALAQDAAVHGKVFWLGALTSEGRGSRWEVEERLHALERRELIRRERRSSVAGDVEYAFRHVLVRDVAYSQIPRGARADKHHAAAEWIERLGRPEDHAEMLAHHYLAALELARAAGRATQSFAASARSALRDAGDRATALHNFAAAAKYYAAALELSSDEDPDRARLLLAYGRALRWAEEGGDEALIAAHQALVARGANEDAAEALSHLLDLAWRRGRREEAVASLEQAIALTADSPPSRAKAVVLNESARFRMLMNQDADAVGLGREAESIARSLGLDDVRADALVTIGTARAHLGDEDGLADIQRGLEVAPMGSYQRLRAFNNLASSTEDRGDLGRVLALRIECLEEAERFGNAVMIRWMRGTLTEDLYWAGRWDEAMQLADEFLTEVDAGSPHTQAATSLSARARIRLARGDADGAVADTTRALSIAREFGEPQFLFPALATHARVLLESGDAARAATVIDEVEQALAVHGSGRTIELAELAFVLSALGDREAARRTAERGVPGLWVCAARAYAAGDFIAAAEAFAAMPSRPDEAYARLRAAEEFAAEQNLAEADLELQKALGFYRSVGATRYIVEAEALLSGPVEKRTSVSQ